MYFAPYPMPMKSNAASNLYLGNGSQASMGSLLSPLATAIGGFSRSAKPGSLLMGWRDGTHWK